MFTTKTSSALVSLGLGASLCLLAGACTPERGGGDEGRLDMGEGLDLASPDHGGVGDGEDLGSPADLGPSLDLGEPPDLGDSLDLGPPADVGGDAGGGIDTPPASFPIEPGVHQGRLESGGREREFWVQIPEGFSAQTSPALLFMLHGGGGRAEQYQGTFGFMERARDSGVVVVYPQGIQQNWADGRGTTDAAQEGVDDVAFFRDMVEHFAVHLAVDLDRVWVTGVSNGGMMSHRLACDLADVFTAAAPVIAALPSAHRPQCQPAQPIPLLAIQGTDDPFIPIEGGDTKHDRFQVGDGGDVESASETERFWATQNACEEAPEVERLEPRDPDDTTRVERRVHDACADAVAVHYYIVEGMGHTWPPREGRGNLSGPRSTQLDATELIWDFLMEYGDRSAP